MELSFPILGQWTRKVAGHHLQIDIGRAVRSQGPLSQAGQAILDDRAVGRESIVCNSVPRGD